MEGSAISRSVEGPMRISTKDASSSHPAISNVVSNADKATPTQNIGREKFIDSNPRGGSPKIKGGQNV